MFKFLVFVLWVLSNGGYYGIGIVLLARHRPKSVCQCSSESRQNYKVFLQEFVSIVSCTFRYLRVYAVEQKFKCVHSVSKMTVPENQVLSVIVVWVIMWLSHDSHVTGKGGRGRETVQDVDWRISLILLPSLDLLPRRKSSCCSRSVCCCCCCCLRHCLLLLFTNGLKKLSSVDQTLCLCWYFMQ